MSFLWQGSDANEVEGVDCHSRSVLKLEKKLSPVQSGDMLLETFLKSILLSLPWVVPVIEVHPQTIIKAS